MSNATDSPLKFHLSLNVSNLEVSAAFYQELFGLPPIKHHADYAKFELSEPPVVFSLIPGRRGAGGHLNHMGLCLPNSEALVAIQARLEAGGHRTLREDGVACCYARQTKFWVRDPDGLLLELYVFHEDLEEHGDGQVPQHDWQEPSVHGGTCSDPAPITTWTHALGDPLLLPLSWDANSMDEVLLEGSFNDSLDHAALLSEALRVLKPGGRLVLHGLASDRPLQEVSPALNGPAARVRQVPDLSRLASHLAKAGFHGARWTKLSEIGYFEVEGVPLREVWMEATKPGFRASSTKHTVVYLGPLAAVEDDFGNRFLKGQPVSLCEHDWQSLKKSDLGTAFQQL